MTSSARAENPAAQRRSVPGGRVLSYRSLLLLVASLPLVIAASTWIVGEQIEVAVLRTYGADGRGHDTKLWVVDHHGQPWLRAGRKRLGWIERIRRNPRVELVRHGVAVPYTASIEEAPEARRAVDAAMAEKYGWIDRCLEIPLRHEPVAIRLDPAPGAG
jgi:hypothetical protein